MVTLLRRSDGRWQPSIRVGTDQARRPRLRSRQLHAEQDAHRQSHCGVSDAAVYRHAASGRRLRLASVGDSHRKLWAVAYRLHRPRQRAQWAGWHHQPDDRTTSQPNQRRRVWTEDPDAVPEPGGVRAAGARYLRQSCPREHYRTRTVGGQYGVVADADVVRRPDRGVPGRGVQPVESLQLGAPRDEPPAGHVRADHFAGNGSADLAVWREVRLLAALSARSVLRRPGIHYGRGGATTVWETPR